MKVGIIWVRSPERSWSNIFIQQTWAGSHENSQVVSELIADLNAVLKKVSASHDIVDDISG